MQWLEFIAYAGTAYWCMLALLLFYTRNPQCWASNWPGQLPEPSPSVAMIFAARDEQRNIKAAVTSMLRLGAPVSEIIAVDDRSTDQTTEILRQQSALHARLRVVRVDRLPSGWLGKTHALQKGLESTNADWVLLTDADVTFDESVVRRALQAGIERNVQHVIGFPEMLSSGFAERCMLAVFYVAFSMRAPAFFIENFGKECYMGVGAFNLVRRDALMSIGGFTGLKLSIDEDLRLGQALKTRGYKCAMLFLENFACVEWQVGLLGTIRGLEKNVFANMGFSIPKTLGSVLGMLAVFHIPILALVVGQPITAGLVWAAMIAIMVLAHKQTRLSPLYGLTFPIGAWLLGIAMLNSMVATLRRGGVVWRDSFYSSKDLIAHIRERSAWLKRIYRERSGRS